MDDGENVVGYDCDRSCCTNIDPQNSSIRQPEMFTVDGEIARFINSLRDAHQFIRPNRVECPHHTSNKAEPLVLKSRIM